MDFEILSWDSDLFGFRTAVIKRPVRNAAHLGELLAGLRKLGVQLVYYSSPNELGDFAENMGGLLVDRKTTFLHNLAKFSQPAEVILAEPYDRDFASSEMESLAIQGGAFSRFALDPCFPKEKFEQLYRIWIRRSVHKEIAQEVLVIRSNGNVVGLVTLAEHKGWGEIGLLAVDRDHRRRRYGRSLVWSALEWCRRQGLSTCRVVTQGRNTAACQLYATCGFEVEKVAFFYHFWL